jgi:serine/threonine protein kinase/tetratricopeptide (TPR) repeat protein
VDQVQDSEPAEFTPPPDPRFIAERPRSPIGPYKLLQQIGEGGMGTVYMAEQQEPVRRKVALKIIKPGMESPHVIARIEAERQALAMMDHQSIARVLDAGTTESGRPYFVMELVHGVPITKFCDDNKLTPRERLALFVPVCQAIQHAHQKGIIHRDIKPSNVLVTMYDDKPVPKVIDFGVAKAIEQRLTEKTLFTQFGTFVGTFEYMSPEQAEMNAFGVDTRSDIYSLGVLFYELLTGTTPLDRKRLCAAALYEVVRLIKEEEPPRPSVRLSSSSNLPKIASVRKTEPARLSKLVRGDLDWIVMKCLEKDRTRRYETANGLARDVERYLHDEPVEACPPSTVYRLREFVKRSKGQVAAAVLVAAVFLLGSAVSTWQAVRATRAEIEARHNEALARNEEQKAQAAAAAEAAQRSRAEENERQSKAVLSFFVDKVLAPVRPEGLWKSGLGKDLTLRKAVDAAAPGIAVAFADQPLVEAEIRTAMGQTYYLLAEYGLAIDQLERALALRQAKLGLDHPDTLTTMDFLGGALRNAGNLDKGLPLLEQTFTRRKVTLGPYHRDTLGSMTCLGHTYIRVGKLDQGLSLVEEAFKLAKDKLGEGDSDTLSNMYSLGCAYQSTGKSAQAVPLLEEALARAQANLGPNHGGTLDCTFTLARAYRSAGRLTEVLPLLEQMVRIYKTKDGPLHRNTILYTIELAWAYQAIGRHADAVRLGEEVLEVRKAKLEPDHPDMLDAMHYLAGIYGDAGRAADAVPLFEDVLRRRKNKKAPDQSDTMAAMGGLGLALLRLQKHAEAEPLLRECLAIREKTQPDLWTTFNTQSLLGGALLGQKKYAEAEPLLLAGYEGMKQRRKSIPPQGATRIPEALDRLLDLYTATSRPDEVKKWQAERAKYPEAKKPETKK